MLSMNESLLTFLDQMPVFLAQLIVHSTRYCVPFRLNCFLRRKLGKILQNLFRVMLILKTIIFRFCLFSTRSHYIYRPKYEED